MLNRYAPGDLPKEALIEQIRERLSQRKLHQGRRDLKEELLARYKVENKMEEALGPDPRSTRPKIGPRTQPKPDGLPPEHPPIGDGSLPPKNAPSPGTPAKGKTGPDAVEEPKGADADGGDGE